MNSFERVISRIIKLEGGFVDNENDNGGPTKYGITKNTLESYRRLKDGSSVVTTEDVKNLTYDEAVEIYKTQYADAIKFDSLPNGVGCAILDFVIHSGQKNAIPILQKLVGVVPDGLVGVRTITAISKVIKEQGELSLIRELTKKRLDFVKSLRDSKHFLRGWTRRINDINFIATGLTKPADPFSPTKVFTPPPVETVSSGTRAEGAKKRTATKNAKDIIGIASGIGAFLMASSDKVLPMINLFPLMKHAFSVLFLAGVIFTLIGMTGKKE